MSRKADTDEIEAYTRLLRASALLQSEAERLAREARRMLHKKTKAPNRQKTAADKAADQAALAGT